MNRRVALTFLLALGLTVALVLGVHRWRQHSAHHRHRHPRLRPPIIAATTPVPRPQAQGGAVTPAPSPTVPLDPLAVAVEAIAAQFDPAKLATLKSREANSRIKRIVFYLALARDAGADPGEVIEAAQQANGSAGTPRAPMLEASLLRNLKIADGLGLLTPENRQRLSHGAVPTVTRGPYAGRRVEVDHVVPYFYAPELDHELANLELLPANLNRVKKARVGERQMDYARRFQEAGLLQPGTLERLHGVFKPASTADMELAVP